MIGKFSCMKGYPIGRTVAVFLIILLFSLTLTVPAAALDPLQQKGKFFMDWSDFNRAGDQAKDPTERINNYLQAESKLEDTYKYKAPDAA
jgi:hypothetical protein